MPAPIICTEVQVSLLGATRGSGPLCGPFLPLGCDKNITWMLQVGQIVAVSTFHTTSQWRRSLPFMRRFRCNHWPEAPYEAPVRELPIREGRLQPNSCALAHIEREPGASRLLAALPR